MEGKRAGIFETVGAWLHVWTPPRDVEVPPVPWRGLLVFGVPTLAAVVMAAFVVIGNASESKEERERADARKAAQRTAVRRKQITAEQSARTGRGQAASPPVGPAEKNSLVRALENAVLADELRRVDEGTLGSRATRVDCVPHPRTAPRRQEELDPRQTRGRYNCLAVTSEVRGTGRGQLGYAYLAAIGYTAGTFVFCKINPVPGEQLIADPRGVVELPRECR